ncbi:sugar phosphate isomerase/epimerase family protein [Singulisphaera sp. PoT]|uniref:sugar phosphate isomerase/epimerase family protein n=1 Tax=Singulisphaera sp. PoT TaxID=3411797 RepID=UPI003BF5A2A5
MGALSLGSQLRPAFAEAPYGPFKLGLQSYSLRGYTKGGQADVEKALAVTKELGLHFWESYPAHVPPSTDPAAVAASKKKVEAEGVKVIGYGVVHFTKDHAANKNIFTFAKELGVDYVSADPDPDSFESLDKLVEEFGIAVGIHNHGPGHRYDLIDKIAKVIKDHHPKIGCCVDTGHFLRSKEDPVRAVEVFGKRVYGVHLKDVKDAEHFTILGKGDLRTVDLFKALAKINYSYCLAVEYEESPENPYADLVQCLATAKAAAAAL